MPGSPILSFGPYRLDIQKEQFWRETQPVRLTPKAFKVLCYVVERPGQLVTKEELFRVLWTNTVVSDAALTTCVQEIRKALQDNSKSPQYLETVHRRGFRFIGNVLSSRESVVSREEPSTNGQEIDIAMSVQAAIQEPHRQSSGEPHWIPGFVEMTQPPS